MQGNYWQKLLSGRVSRRKALVASGMTTLGAAFLAACGSDDGPAPTGSATQPSSTGTGATGGNGETSLLSPRVDETSDGVAGGIFPYNHGANVVAIDPHTTFNAAAFALITPVYSTMVKYGMAVDSFPGADTITGDAMESWETAPDGLSVTYKLRQNHKFDHRPPTSGRAMTVEDVKWSWERVAATSPVTADILRDLSPTGMIESFSFPDNETVTVHLAEPYGALQEVLAYTFYFHIAPIEADSGLDLQNEARGSGPFYLESFEPDIRLRYKRNPEWYMDNRPFLDGYDALFISEVAQQEAQFQAGQLWNTGATVLPDSVLRFKRERPHLKMFQNSVFGAPGAYPLLFGKRFAADVRLRQAASLLFDRQALIEAAYDTTTYTNAGLDVPVYWDGHLSNRASEWLDPSGDELGEGAQWFQYNPEEAKALMDAAGYQGETLVMNFRANFGPTNVPMILHGMLNEGFNVELRPLEVNLWRELKDSYGEGFDDFLWSTSNSYNADGYLATKYTAGGKDKVMPDSLPGISEAILEMRRELDTQARIQKIHQIQRDLANEMPDLPVVSTLPVAGFYLTQPWLRNYQWVVPGFSVSSSSARPLTAYWVDEAARQQYGG